MRKVYLLLIFMITLGLVALLMPVAHADDVLPMDPKLRRGIEVTDDAVTIKGGRSLSVGASISATGTEYTIWEIQDDNGDVVAACTVECSNITDGSQVCQIHFYVMSDTPGTLTEELTVDVDSD